MFDLLEKIMEKEGKEIIYHITTIENYEEIKKSGGLDPSKTVGKETLFSFNRNEALSILSTTQWGLRETKGYMLLIFEVSSNLITGREKQQGRSNKFISLDYLQDVEKLPKPAINIVRKYISDRDNLEILLLKDAGRFKYKVFSRNIGQTDLNRPEFPLDFIQGVDFSNLLSSDEELQDFEEILKRRGYQRK